MANTRTDDPTPQGGWHTPEEESTVAPEAPALPGWKVPALPTELNELPGTAGGWHRPRMVDTTLTPQDETVVLMPVEEAQTELPQATQVAPEELPAILSPEDALQTLPSEPQATEVQEKLKAAEPVSPEDALSMVALASDEDEEEEAGIRTELLALNMLAGDQAAAPAEGKAEEGAAEDPAEVARRKLAELDAGYTGFDASGAGLAAAEPAAAPALTGEQMRAQELARRFSQTQEDVEQIRTLYRQGTITPEQFEAELQNRMIHDDDQIWWRMGADDAAWYKYVNDQWTPAVPPLAQGARAGLQTERLNPANDPFGGTLPYIGESSPVEQSVGSTMPMSYGYTPLPNVVPTEDIDNTMVSPAAFRDALAQPTVAGATVPIGTRTGTGAASLGYGSSPGIQSAIDETVPPEIDYTMPVGTIAQEAQERSRSNTARNGVLVLVGVIALALIAVAAGLVVANNWYSGIVSAYEPQIAALAAYEPEFQTVVIQDAEKHEIARLADGGDRIEVDLGEISPFLIHAVIATRNPTFYTDPGWDTGSTIQAWLGGASAPSTPTITQLVARNLVLSSGGSDVDLLVVAGELSQRYTKDFILGLFLNEFPFGNSTFGAEAASQFYFQKGANELSLPEAALLASIMENPGGIDPVTNKGIVKPAIENVYARMAQVGCLDIPGRGRLCIAQSDFNNRDNIVRKGELELMNYQPRDVTTRYPHFVNLVRQQLEAVYGSELYARGFTVQTTLVPLAQDAAQDLLKQRLAELSGTGITTGAVIWSDPMTGAIRAYIGSPDYDDPNTQGQRDFARDFLTPGGAIMPIVYAAAMEGVDRNGNGTFDFGEYITAGNLAWDVPAQYPASPTSPPFEPRNIDGRFYGPISVREALANQYFPATTRIYADLGGDVPFQQMAERMGLQFSGDSTFGLPTAVGETRVRLKDLMTAYGTIANGGVRRPVYAIDRITDRNGVEVQLPEQIKPIEARAFSPQIAWVLQNILSDDLARNTALFPRNGPLVIGGLPNQNEVGALAATNAARTNLWTVGFTSNAVVGVWLGTPNSTVSFSNQTGFTAAAPLWNHVMSLVVAGLGSRNPPHSFPDPGGMAFLPVCAATGTSYNQQVCPSAARNELFPQTRQPIPVELGPVVSVAINTWTGLRVNPNFCGNAEDITQRSFVNTSDPFIVNWLRSPEGRATAQRLGLGTEPQAAPTAECDVNSQLPTANITSPTNGQSIQGDVPIIGQVLVPVNFNRWQLEFAPQGTASYQMLPGFPQQVQQPNPNTTLTTWDTRTIPNGVYSIRLTVIGNDGGFVFRGVNVSINNPLPTATPTPTIAPTAFPTFPPFDQATAIPFDIVPTFGPSPTPNPF